MSEAPEHDKSDEKKPEKGAKRRATQQRMVEAFERVLMLQGADQLGVNAVVKEAGVAKGLLYRYFGGLDGLAQAWLEQNALSPGAEDIAGESLDAFAERSAPERLARIHVNYATMLRDHPAAARLLVEDLRVGSELPEPLERARLNVGASHERLVTSDPEFASPDMMAKIFVLHAAANYLALRANSSPNFNGVPLDTDEGWAMVMDMLALVAGDIPVSDTGD